MRFALAAITLVSLTAPAWADGNNMGPDSERFLINMSVPPLCRFGEVEGGDGKFEVGVLTESSTGLLRQGLTAPVQRLQGSFCNAPSELRVQATLMTPTTSSRPAPSGFSRGVDFTATVSGWTDSPAIFQTDVTGDQATATQRQSRPRQSELVVAVSDFHTDGGSNLRPIASTRYEGLVVVTLGPAP